MISVGEKVVAMITAKKGKEIVLKTNLKQDEKTKFKWRNINFRHFLADIHGRTLQEGRLCKELGYFFFKMGPERQDNDDESPFKEAKERLSSLKKHLKKFKVTNNA